jgi:GTP-binding protein YchF
VSRVSLSIGIVGLPNVGKSTLFNALTKNDVLAANYPFATIEPNVGVVGVPDARLGVLAELFSSQKVIPATVDFVDIAGIVKGASEGEGLGNKFLANIRDSDAVCQVIRVFQDDNVVHVDGRVSPKDDIETINTELILADLQTIERAIPRLEKEVRLKKEAAATLEAVKQAQAVLDAGQTVHQAGLDLAPLRELHLLTAKPFLYVFNLDEDELADAGVRAELATLVAPSEAVFLDAKVESELIEMAEDEALELLQSMGQDESGLQGGPRLDDPQGRHGPRGRRRHPHRLPARLHQGRGDRVRRPGRAGLGGRRPRRRQGAHGGQGLRDAGRRRGGVPLQRVVPKAAVSSRRPSASAPTSGSCPGSHRGGRAAWSPPRPPSRPGPTPSWR